MHSAYLHYVANDATVRTGDFFLLDAGGEYMGYATDITSMKIATNYKKDKVNGKEIEEDTCCISFIRN